MYDRVIFRFRQDLRVYDNIGLFYAIENSKEILPIFIIDKNIEKEFGGLENIRFGFIREACEFLNKQFKIRKGNDIQIFYDSPEDIIPKLVGKYNIKAIFTNRAYDNYGIKRDEKVKKNINIKFFSIDDFLLVPPENIPVRKVFSPFYKIWQKTLFNTKEVDIDNINSFEVPEGKHISYFIKNKKHNYFTIQFGKKRLVENIMINYEDKSNFLDIDGTSQLSPYIRFGIFSIREIYNKAKHISESFVSELAWRDFWHHIYYNFPYTKNTEFLEKRKIIKWSHDVEKFEKWCKGETGYPLVDACMKQLLKINRMHGRGRMIVSSFLVKDLHIDRRRGESFFKKHLLDYDEAVNIGNWQWGGSVGADPKPLRIFNPILQSQKFDQNAIFIKKYIPSLKNEKVKKIHDILKNQINYIEPIVNHNEEQRITKEIYKKARDNFLGN